jgi:hypothetical protein
MAINLNGVTPAAPSGSTNVLWQEDASGNVSAYVAGSPTFLSPSPLVTLATQGAAQTNTALFTPTASGLYRISFYAKVTRAATSSSTLGGATGFSVTFTDATDSTASVIATTSNVGSAVNAGNLLTSAASGSLIINALTGVAVTFSYGYTSSGATTMQYEMQVFGELA